MFSLYINLAIYCYDEILYNCCIHGRTEMAKIAISKGGELDFKLKKTIKTKEKEWKYSKITGYRHSYCYYKRITTITSPREVAIQHRHSKMLQQLNL